MLRLAGLGKTDLAISPAIAAAQNGRCVYYGNLRNLIAALEDALSAGRFGQRLRLLTRPSLLVVDEIGYLHITRQCRAARLGLVLGFLVPLALSIRARLYSGQ